MARTHDAPMRPEKLETLGDRVRCILFIRDMGINELDRILGKAGYTTRIVRNERMPRSDTAVELADALRVPSWWLFAPGDEPKRTAWHAALLRHIDEVRAAFNEVRTKLSADAADAFLQFCIGDIIEPKSPKEPNILLAVLLFSRTTIGQASPKLNGASLDKCLAIAARYIEHNPPPSWAAATYLYFLDFIGDPLLSKSQAQKPRDFELRDAPGWQRALEEAQVLYPSASQESFIMAARAPAPDDLYVDAQLVGELARSYHEAAIRARAAKKK